MTGRSYRDLIAWQKAMDLGEEVFALTEHWPKQQMFGLALQVQRAAISIPSNIAEGQGRLSQPEFNRFLRIAKGSLFELETQLMMARRARFIDDVALDRLLTRTAEVGRLLHGLMRSLQPRTDSQETRSHRPLTTDD